MWIYYVMMFLAAAALVIFNLSLVKKHTLSRRGAEWQHSSKNKINWVVVEVLLISLVQYVPAMELSRFSGALGGGDLNYFVLMLTAPFIMLALFCFLGTDPMRSLDLFTPAYPLALIFSKIGCFFAGCCGGIESEYGLYNSATGLTEVPVQLIEAFNALLIFMFLLCYRKFAKKGNMYPMYLILYSATRLCSEFLRSEQNVIWILKTYHILCLTGIIVGVAELILVSVNREKLVKFFKKSMYKGKNKA